MILVAFNKVLQGIDQLRLEEEGNSTCLRGGHVRVAGNLSIISCHEFGILQS